MLIVAGALAALAGAAPLAAQSGDAVSRAVVQPLPPPGIEDLNEALRRLARNAADFDALIDAGNASLELNDVDAAIGFFGRAQELSPNSPLVKLGLAGAYVRSERPIDALRLFEEAERGGVSTAGFASERGLAYDLVGDNAAAQAQYQQALAAEQDEETARRLALSQAIAGDREAFEKTLYPQLEGENFAGFRARAFGLAILGDVDEAVAIAEAVMPADLSARISPYLRYMGRLTKAQQAAAVNLGVFPRAAQIGRDDPRIAQYSSGSPAASSPGAQLAPAGAAMNASAPAVTDATRGSGSMDSRAPAPEPTPSVAAPQAAPPTVSQPVVQQIPEPVSTPAGSQPAAATASVASTMPSGELPPAAGAIEQSTRVVLGGDDAPAPGFDLGSAANSSVGAAAAATPPQQSAPRNLADAFAGFTLAPSTSPAAASGAVDITTIEIPREVERKPPPEPAPPAHPSRIWVQVATGKDLEAFKWDWRRISRKAPEILGDFKPMTTPWVEANRLLAGPFKSRKDAADAVAALREAEVDSFVFTSDAGQEILPLD
ncbi:SPOR domain-containing protein [Pelagerythrobacter sp.]|uniref:SPOR domain-containing protein n=1 Tax=Pelagerythrobacter sp. TaxID=2800702 RepID=UPI0035B10292